MQRTFKNDNQTVKINSKVIDRIYAVFERLKKECPDACLMAKCGLTFDTEIKGDDTLVVTIDKCPGINDALDTEVFQPYSAMMETGRIGISTMKDWYEDVQMIVDERQETITYDLKGFCISSRDSSSDDQVTIHFHTGHIFALRDF